MRVNSFCQPNLVQPTVVRRASTLEPEQNVLSIPRNAHNFYAGMAFDKATAGILAVMKTDQYYKTEEVLEHTEFLRSLGERTNLSSSSTVYAPRGGFNSAVLYGLVPAGKDFISYGLDKFGSPNQVLTGMNKVNGKKETISSVALSYDMYDSVSYSSPGATPDYSTTLRAGLGAISIGKLIAYSKANVTGIKYFNLNQDGSFNFCTHPTQRGFNSNAIIEFQDDMGNQKRFWYFSHDSRKETPAFTEFIKKLKFQSLIVLGGTNFLGPETRSNEIDQVVIPSIANNAQALTDGGNNKALVAELPYCFPIPQGNRIGYAYGGSGDVYYGPASALHTVSKTQLV
jgi:hypothetical protein